MILKYYFRHTPARSSTLRRRPVIVGWPLWTGFQITKHKRSRMRAADKNLTLLVRKACALKGVSLIMYTGGDSSFSQK
jgi:hypothetical protein